MSATKYNYGDVPTRRVHNPISVTSAELSRVVISAYQFGVTHTNIINRWETKESYVKQGLGEDSARKYENCMCLVGHVAHAKGASVARLHEEFTQEYSLRVAMYGVDSDPEFHHPKFHLSDVIIHNDDYVKKLQRLVRNEFNAARRHHSEAADTTVWIGERLEFVPWDFGNEYSEEYRNLVNANRFEERLKKGLVDKRSIDSWVRDVLLPSVIVTDEVIELVPMVQRMLDSFDLGRCDADVFRSVLRLFSDGHGKMFGAFLFPSLSMSAYKFLALLLEEVSGPHEVSWRDAFMTVYAYHPDIKGRGWVVPHA